MEDEMTEGEVRKKEVKSFFQEVQGKKGGEK